MRRNRLGVLRGRRRLLLLTLCLLALVALPALALAGETTKIFVMDRCEPESFDAAVEPGTCVRNGGVTFDKFAKRLNPEDGGHNAWTFNRHDLVVAGDQTLTLINNGGEVHTFTEVANFGTGFVPDLNATLPPVRRPPSRSARSTSCPPGRCSSRVRCRREPTCSCVHPSVDAIDGRAALTSTRRRGRSRPASPREHASSSTIRAVTRSAVSGSSHGSAEEAEGDRLVSASSRWVGSDRLPQPHDRADDQQPS